MWDALSQKLGVRTSLVKRLAVTIAAGLFVILGGLIPVPTVEISQGMYGGGARHPLTVGELGLLPFVLAFAVVEAGAWVWADRDTNLAVANERPTWMAPAAVAFGLFVCAAYGAQFARYVYLTLPDQFGAGIPVGDLSSMRTMGTAVSIAAGSGLYYLLARWISRSGVGDGFAVVIGAGIAWEIVPASREFEDWLRGMSFENLDVFAVLGNVLAVSFVILVALWAVTRFESWVVDTDETGEGDGASSFGPQVDARTSFHVPVAGIVPFWIGTSFLWLLWLGRGLLGIDAIQWLEAGLETIPHGGAIPYFLQELTVVVIVGGLIGRWMVGRGPSDTASRRRAQLGSLGFLVVLVVLDVFGGSLVRSLGVVNLVIATSIGYDLYREWRFRRAFEGAVPIRDVHRASEVGAVVAKLASAGVPTFVRARAFRGMLRGLAACTPCTVFVPERCHDTAAAVLEGRRPREGGG